MKKTDARRIAEGLARPHSGNLTDEGYCRAASGAVCTCGREGEVDSIADALVSAAFEAYVQGGNDTVEAIRKRSSK